MHHVVIMHKLTNEATIVLLSQVRKKNDIIKHLQADLHQIDRCSKENISHLRQEAEKQEVTDEKNSVVKCQKLQLDSSQMRLQLQSDITQHRETEYEFRRVS